MFKLQNQLKIISICLLAFLGMLLINNNQVMARENGNINNNGNINQNNRNINPIMEACRNLHDLLLEEARLINQIYNVIRNNDSEETIRILINQTNEIALQAENIRRNINNNQNQPNNNRRN
ncbi:Conserved hypothetical protein [Candidatus Phytoplasma australiense]|uniref:Sequence-variable mosaic (SVM) signal sequence domain-containing protein n=1 Tax=Phytoplasma australiense TaxID=59748 RepID=B1V988_PHYAS|nr:Conserved hypothetical protein [Candidatus Phytoplasma australiense]